MRNLTAELQQCNGYQSTCLRTCFGQWGQSRCIPSFDFQSTGEAYWIHPVCLVCPWLRACAQLSTPEPWCVVFVQVSVCVYVSTLNPCTYTVRARVHASSPVPGAVPQQTEHWSSIPRIEVQYSRIQDSRFKVPAQSFPRILNLESWIRGSIELQSRGLNFNTPGSKIQDSRFQHKVSPGSWILNLGSGGVLNFNPEDWTSILACSVCLNLESWIRQPYWIQ